MMFAMVVTVDELSDAERRVWNAFPAGTLVNFLTGIAGNDDPAGGEHWGEDRQVRAEVLLALLCGAVEVEPGQLGAVNLQGARITSAIKLPEAKFKHPLVLNRCYIGDGIVQCPFRGTSDLQGCDPGDARWAAREAVTCGDVRPPVNGHP
jgi:hypothetical protein